MAPLFLSVRPGDLITADFVNSIIAELNSLEYRVQQLEKGQPTGPPLQGALDVTYQDVTPNPITSGSTPIIRYHLRSRANLTAQCNIIPSISGGSGVTWQVAVLDVSKNPLQSPFTIRLDPGQETDFFVQVSSIPAGVTKFSMGLTVTASNLTSTDGPRDFLVGTPTPPQDTTITASQPVIQSGGSINLGSNTLTVAPGAKAVLSITFTLQPTATPPVNYVVSAQASAGWQAVLDPLTPANFTIQASDLTGPSRQATRILTFNISPNAGASPGATTQLQVQQQGAASARTVILSLTTG